MSSPMFVWITYRQDYEGGGEAIEPEDAWSGHETTYYSWDLMEVSLNRPGMTYNELIRCGAMRDDSWVDEGAQEDATVWVVCVIYSSGDTFGSSSGNGCVVCACTDEASAKLIETQIHAGETPAMLSWAPWSGYFEGLEEVRVEKRTVLA